MDDAEGSPSRTLENFFVLDAVGFMKLSEELAVVPARDF